MPGTTRPRNGPEPGKGFRRACGLIDGKNKEERQFAAKALVYSYYRPRWTSDGKKWSTEDLPEKENRALLAIAELPWVPPDGDRSKPCLAETIYFSIEPTKFGFKVPSAERVQADKRPSPRDRLVEEDLSKFLKENVDKIS